MEGSQVRRKRKALRIVDGQLFARMARNLGRDPMQCLRVIALWKWLESEFGYRNTIHLLLTDTEVSAVHTMADEAVHCINCFLSEIPPPDHSSLAIPNGFLNQTHISWPAQNRYTRIPLPTLHRYRMSALRRISETVDDVILVRAALQMSALINNNHIPLLNPALPIALVPSAVPPPIQERMLDQNLYHIINQVPLGERRTMMITFSRANPITEIELTDFFVRFYGRDCIEQCMEVANPPVRPSCCYVIVVFRSAETAAEIFSHCEEDQLVEFVLNGKPVTAIMVPSPA
ncbi:hypothetical protein BVC80_1835g583 [Macleaya cordata]|uniref:Uncharacterized protein n=1 Tax=Macleaya cordata TaxID=56857 RepID=A0A200R648_MACCD|nr:hypothetical protein BVC80_1835g583 [Macleaya cordata]